MLIVLFLVSHFNFLFVLCGGLSWLLVSFLLHVKYTLLYRIVCLHKYALCALIKEMIQSSDTFENKDCNTSSSPSNAAFSDNVNRSKLTCFDDSGLFGDSEGAESENDAVCDCTERPGIMPEPAPATLRSLLGSSNRRSA